MRALAHPQQSAILKLLMSGPPRTATECAAEVDASPSACSYHLRELERFGFVERAESVGDQRARPWRAASVGFALGGDWAEDSPAGRAARHALGRAELAENLRLVDRFLGAVDALDPAWQSASDFHDFELLVTPQELVELNGAVAALLRRYRA